MSSTVTNGGNITLDFKSNAGENFILAPGQTSALLHGRTYKIFAANAPNVDVNPESTSTSVNQSDYITLCNSSSASIPIVLPDGRMIDLRPGACFTAWEQGAYRLLPGSRGE